jgi:hypothetical protein
LTRGKNFGRLNSIQTLKIYIPFIQTLKIHIPFIKVNRLERIKQVEVDLDGFAE